MKSNTLQHLKLVSSQPYSDEDRAKAAFAAAQNACSRDDWQEALHLYEKADQAIAESRNLRDTRGKVQAYMAFCLLFLHRIYDADLIIDSGLNLITSNTDRETLAHDYKKARARVLSANKSGHTNHAR